MDKVCRWRGKMVEDIACDPSLDLIAGTSEWCCPFLADPTNIKTMMIVIDVKTGRPRGRGYRTVNLGSMVTETWETMFIQVRALLMEIKPYVLLLFILMKSCASAL